MPKPASFSCVAGGKSSGTIGSPSRAAVSVAASRQIAVGVSIDAACAMLGAVCTMHDVLCWGGETQALIYNPKTGKVIGLNALGVAPSGATVREEPP